MRSGRGPSAGYETSRMGDIPRALKAPGDLTRRLFNRKSRSEGKNSRGKFKA